MGMKGAEEVLKGSKREFEHDDDEQQKCQQQRLQNFVLALNEGETDDNLSSSKELTGNNFVSKTW